MYCANENLPVRSYTLYTILSHQASSTSTSHQPHTRTHITSEYSYNTYLDRATLYLLFSHTRMDESNDHKSSESTGRITLRRRSTSYSTAAPESPPALGETPSAEATSRRVKPSGSPLWKISVLGHSLVRIMKYSLKSARLAGLASSHHLKSLRLPTTWF